MRGGRTYGDRQRLVTTSSLCGADDDPVSWLWGSQPLWLSSPPDVRVQRALNRREVPFKAELRQRRSPRHRARPVKTSTVRHSVGPGARCGFTLRDTSISATTVGRAFATLRHRSHHHQQRIRRIQLQAQPGCAGRRRCLLVERCWLPSATPMGDPGDPRPWSRSRTPTKA